MISVAMTTYNGEAYIEQQLRSILEQSLPPDEIIICDDCSKDQTTSIIRNIMAENPSTNITLLENRENLGYIRNFYQAIQMTTGEYIFLADQDDVWHPDKIEKTFRVMESSGAAAVCTNFHLIDKYGNEIPDKSCFDISPFVARASDRLTPVSFGRLVIGNLVQGCTYCFTKEVKGAYLHINSPHLIHDHQIMFVAAALGTVYFLNEELIDYRLHTTNAVGFRQDTDGKRIRWKKPTRKPVMVRFLEDLSKGVKVSHVGFYKLMYYLRLPYFYSVLEKRWSKS